ncbi:unnamed protein product [Symbiodinium necroappetens]|uniref:Uncharacterized protein n=1 Tax=Symbiodinium necroappetens TaxID=1628268 RepID=A0A812JN77_9DINO|nr:unnamed protein product [Symbiodinium necroappetens]
MYIKFLLPNDTPSLDGITTCPLQCQYEQNDFTNNVDCVTQNVLEAHFRIGPPSAGRGVAKDPLVDVCLILMDWQIVDVWQEVLVFNCFTSRVEFRSWVQREDLWGANAASAATLLSRFQDEELISDIEMSREPRDVDDRGGAEAERRAAWRSVTGEPESKGTTWPDMTRTLCAALCTHVDDFFWATTETLKDANGVVALALNDAERSKTRLSIEFAGLRQTLWEDDVQYVTCKRLVISDLEHRARAWHAGLRTGLVPSSFARRFAPAEQLRVGMAMADGDGDGSFGIAALQEAISMGEKLSSEALEAARKLRRAYRLKQTAELPTELQENVSVDVCERHLSVSCLSCRKQHETEHAGREMQLSPSEFRVCLCRQRAGPPKRLRTG